jgi:endoglycosylceramidase
MAARSPRRGLAVGVALLAGLLAAAPAAAAFGSAGRWLTYPDGRVFIPHGLNLIVTRPPYWAPWFGAGDARLLAAEGFTALRVNIQPSALEPEPGSYDGAYLQHAVETAALLARSGIAVLPSLNQDGYSEACGVDGFPAWAQLAPCDTVWAPFWANAVAADGAGLQDHYLGWWRFAFDHLGAAGNLLGFDLLNEPVAPDSATLGVFWQRTVAALAGSARGRLLFTESGPVGNPTVPDGLPAGAGYSAHVYCWPALQLAFARRGAGTALVDRCIRENAARLRQQLAFAVRNGQPFLVGEFGASDELREQAALVDAMNEAFVPWLAYAYNARLDASGTTSQGLLRSDAVAASPANAKPAKLDALVVPYPVAVAGTPVRWRYDRRTRVVRFRYSTRRAGGGSFGRALATIVFVPRRVYPTGYAIAVEGARAVSAASSPWVRLVAKPGAEWVEVRIRPRTGGRTLTPLQAGRCGYDLRPCGLR